MTTNYQERPRKGGGNECRLHDEQWRRLLPVSFTAENAQKVHAGTKTQTRRLLNPQPDECDGTLVFDFGTFAYIRAGSGLEHHSCDRWRPRYQVGDVMWVQQNWRTERRYDDFKPTQLPDGARIYFEGDISPADDFTFGKLRPGRFLPLRFARTNRYEVTEVRLERVNEISEADALAEGCRADEYDSGSLCAYEQFNILWNLIHDKSGARFDDKPWVWAYTFRRVR